MARSTEAESALECISEHIALSMQNNEENGHLNIPKNSKLKNTLLSQNIVEENTYSLNKYEKEKVCSTLDTIVSDQNKNAIHRTKTKRKTVQKRGGH